MGPNPRIEQGITLTLFDTTGTPAAQTAVSETLGFTGFDCSPTTEIVLPLPASMVELLVVHAATGPTVHAYAGGSLVASVPVTVGPWQPQALPISGPAIDRIVIPAYNTRAKLLRLCFEPAG